MLFQCGTQTVDQALQKLVERGEIEAKVARTKAENKDFLKQGRYIKMVRIKKIKFK